MIIEKGNTYKISYSDSKGVVSRREIIALTEAPKNITALDITSLNETQKQWLINAQKEYQEYVDTHISTMFKFEAWLEHAQNTYVPDNVLKLKRFTVDNIKIIDK